MHNDYEGPTRLTPIPWGKRDKETGFAICAHMIAANPPKVILWSIHEYKILKCMKHDKAPDARLEDIDNLILAHTPTFHRTLSVKTTVINYSDGSPPQTIRSVE